ncbi:ATP-binding protein [Achromobacter piechaudii]|uniref:histidine kinase n=2 Tax=Achromobacter piechaudii TaxID=72556 RepID=A0A6S7CRW3_9BURK|nr:ATP-binding protein [Achromobacter piechaudii]EFF75482.1 putative D-tyrosyl-tRNA(Tyr) deacylase [Achromobacter piechaudii ATCC 43553]KNY10257.1 histidine kinase [Achromobacter piechaudii]CAB3862478.1 Sensor protein RstB [Achromobacter piechaudii]
MLRFVLRLFVVLAVGFVLSNEVVDRTANYFFESVNVNYTREAVRGQLHSLKQELTDVAPEARRAYVRDTLAPHYGLVLQVLDPADYNAPDFALTDDERRTVEAGGFIVRDKLMRFVSAIPGPGAQWLMVQMPPEPPVTTWMIVVIYSALALLLGAFMLVWALPIWRDLEALKTAAQRMGHGDLQARARLSRYSSIRGLGDTFNQMSDRIAALISNQRELTNAVSHELRTPIARLSFELDMIDGETDPAARRRLVEEMKSDVAELDSMASELLMYARLEHKSDDIPLQAQDARGWLESVVQHAAYEAEQLGVQCQVSQCDPGEVRLHPRYMTRALLNLLQNAIRHAGGRVQVALTSPAPHEYVLTVDDDGPGVPGADRERIFEPFIRLDESRARVTGGTGLGLAIVSRVARWHNGAAAVSDSALGGARFEIRWNAA